MIISDQNKKILFASKAYFGKVHDFSIFKEELKNYDFSRLKIWVDSGFLGIKKAIQSDTIWMPYKSSKQRPLDEQDKLFNRFVAKRRIIIENTISDIKRYSILKNRYRNLNMENISETIELCTGLANFKNSATNYLRKLY